MPLSFSEALVRAQSLPTRFNALNQTLRVLLFTFNFFLRISGVLLAVFLIHQLFFWFSKDPEKSFNYATLVIDLVEVTWDLVGILYNTAADILNSAVLPLWNGFTYYVIEPAVTLVLEVFSLIFLRKQYTGFINSEDLQYGGFVCDPTSFASSTWCGRYNAYNQKLAGGDSLTKQGSVTFGTATARRLSEISGDVDFDVPSVNTGELEGALDGLATQAIVMGASAFDVLFAVLYDVMSTSCVFLFDAGYTIFKVLFEILKMIVKSGMLQTLITIGVDFVLIMVLEIYVPLIISIVDAVVCILQLLTPGTWAEQLKCGARSCQALRTFHIPTVVIVAHSRGKVLQWAGCERGFLALLFDTPGHGKVHINSSRDTQFEDRKGLYRRCYIRRGHLTT